MCSLWQQGWNDSRQHGIIVSMSFGISTHSKVNINVVLPGICLQSFKAILIGLLLIYITQYKITISKKEILRII